MPVVVDWLRCPYCAADLELAGQGLDCTSGHHFDLARQGYISLLGRRSRTDTADSAEMVAARASFLAEGWYRPIAAALKGMTAERIFGSARLVELGAGTGYYLGSLLEAFPAAHGVAVDSSVRAARRAALAHPRMASVVADAWNRLPLAAGIADVVLSVFAPRQVEEIFRILSPTGLFVVVTPEPGHLGELIAPFRMLTVDDGKADKLAVDFAGELKVIDRQVVTFEMCLRPDQVKDLVMMGPSARHLQMGNFDATLAALPAITPVTASVTVTVMAR